MLQLEAAAFLELLCRVRNRSSGAERPAVQNRLPPALIPGIIKQDNSPVDATRDDRVPVKDFEQATHNPD